MPIDRNRPRPASIRLSPATMERIREVKTIVKLETNNHSLTDDELINIVLDTYIRNSDVYQALKKDEPQTRN